jgi:hypothetical protein
VMENQILLSDRGSGASVTATTLGEVVAMGPKYGVSYSTTPACMKENIRDTS